MVILIFWLFLFFENYKYFTKQKKEPKQNENKKKIKKLNKSFIKIWQDSAWIKNMPDLSMKLGMKLYKCFEK